MRQYISCTAVGDSRSQPSTKYNVDDVDDTHNQVQPGLHGDDVGDTIWKLSNAILLTAAEKRTSSNNKCRCNNISHLSLSLSLSTAAEKRSSMAAITNADAPPTLLCRFTPADSIVGAWRRITPLFWAGLCHHPGMGGIMGLSGPGLCHYRPARCRG